MARLPSLRDLWDRALHEHTTPRELAWSVAVGVFAGCTPLIGFHALIALAFATALRLNRLWAVVGSRVSFFLLLPWISLAEVQSSHYLRTGAWAPLFHENVIEHAREWLVDWWLGSIWVGAALAAVLGAVAYVLARRRDARRLTPPTPAPDPGRSSGSPP